MSEVLAGSRTQNPVAPVSEGTYIHQTDVTVFTAQHHPDILGLWTGSDADAPEPDGGQQNHIVCITDDF